MALFGKKKQDDDSPNGDATTAEAQPSSGPFQPNPAKASRWFEHARTQHETSNYEYAATCWLKGIAFDPANAEALEGFFESAQAYGARAKKPGPSKDQAKSFGGRTPVDRYVVALLNWATVPDLDAGNGIRAVESAATLGLRDATRWIGEKALASAARVQKPKKEHFIRLKDNFEKVEAFDLATKAGEIALRIDPSDTALDDEVRNLSAQAAMHTGGFDESGEEGGFRKNIKDAEKQQQIREGAASVRTEEASQRVLDEAAADYESRPMDGHAIGKYVRELIKRGHTSDEQRATEVLKKAFEDTKEFRWRQQLGDLEMRRTNRKLEALKRAVKENPGDEEAMARLKKARQDALQQEINEYQVRVEAFPTDRRLKYELGRRLYHVGDFAGAIKHLQEAQADLKIRTAVLNYLGQAFAQLGWHAEAVDMLRQAKDSHTSETDDLGMELRYALMVALENLARETSDAGAAGEAAQLASSLAMQRIDFKDVVERRTKLQALKKELEGEG